MSDYLKNWEAVIGLEIHVQLSTKSKLFSGASTNFGALPNTQACNIDLALPGVLPVLNSLFCVSRIFAACFSVNVLPLTNLETPRPAAEPTAKAIAVFIKALLKFSIP